MSNNYQRNRRFLKAVKQTAGCAEPGCRQDDPRRLQFDHDTGVKNFNLSQAGGRALRTVVREVMLTTVRCDYHHELRHYNRALEAHGRHAELPSERWEQKEKGG